MKHITSYVLGATLLFSSMFLVQRRFLSTSFRPGIVYTTESSLANAKKLARALVQTKVAACVQLKEITSIYEWLGEIEEEKEIQLTIKCDLQQYDELEKMILAQHSYDTPQILAVEAVGGSKDYLSFVQSGTTK